LCASCMAKARAKPQPHWDFKPYELYPVEDDPWLVWPESLEIQRDVDDILGTIKRVSDPPFALMKNTVPFTPLLVVEEARRLVREEWKHHRERRNVGQEIATVGDICRAFMELSVERMVEEIRQLSGLDEENLTLAMRLVKQQWDEYSQKKAHFADSISHECESVNDLDRLVDVAVRVRGIADGVADAGGTVPGQVHAATEGP
jgi:hypothetical protein